MTPAQLQREREAIGKRLKDQRIKKGLTKEKLMNISKLHWNTINKIENGLPVYLDSIIIYRQSLKYKKNLHEKTN